ncbi:hypothetical protein K7X08_025995 [Anisodus acutangulus]|uniref:Uncharacterized protein n=1 Tax=Anisodus acutangulus TaxID=402998 RepID=A0A9Q1RRZ1_9SOLA|nr:hypothetical protein K7X08_025995 [Anisodus acutangulus]
MIVMVLNMPEKDEISPKGERGALIEDGSSVKTKKTKNRKAESEIAFVNALDTELIYRMALLLEIIPSYYSFEQIEHRVTGYFLKIVIINLFLRILGSCFSGPMSRAFEGEESKSQMKPVNNVKILELCHLGMMMAENGRNDTSNHVNLSLNLWEEKCRMFTLVPKIEVPYDKTSKRVDVQVLKETLLDQLNQTSVKKQKFVAWTISMCNPHIIIFIYSAAFRCVFFSCFPVKMTRRKVIPEKIKKERYCLYQHWSHHSILLM